MTVVPTAPGPVAQPAPIAPAAPQPAPAPAPAPAPEPAYAPAPVAPAPVDNFVQVDRGRLEPWGGDYHAALADAQRGRQVGQYGSALELAQQHGVTPDILQEMLTAWAAEPQASAQPYPPQPVPPVLTQAYLDTALQQLQETVGGQMDQRLAGVLEQRDQLYDQRTRVQQSISEANALRETAEQTFLTGLGLQTANEDGTPYKPGRSALRELRDATYTAMAERMPDELSELQAQAKANPSDLALQQRSEAAVSQYYATPNEADLAAAATDCEWLKDNKYEMAAVVAQEQATVPDATGGDGTPGTPPPTDYAGMTPQQRQDAVMGDVDADELE